jgi:hypothetical protein
MHPHPDRLGLRWLHLSREEDREAKKSGKKRPAKVQHGFEGGCRPGAKGVGEIHQFPFSF